MIPVVLVQVPKQREKVRRLVDYCFDLDDTEITVLKAPPEIYNVPPITSAGGGGNGAQLCFEFALHELQGTPFFWIEVDAIPLAPGWRAPIEQQWRESGKQFLLPDLSGLHGNDVASAIGIYPANAIDIIPHGLGWPRLWDLWIYNELPNDIHYTRLIQHSYMCFPQGRNWWFPRDKGIIQPDALLFHRDAYQSLIGGMGPEQIRALAAQQYLDDLAAESEKTRHLGTSAGTRQKNLSTSAELFS